jgi:hypothetical protein
MGITFWVEVDPTATPLRTPGVPFALFLMAEDIRKQRYDDCLLRDFRRAARVPDGDVTRIEYRDDETIHIWLEHAFRGENPMEFVCQIGSDDDEFLFRSRWGTPIIVPTSEEWIALVYRDIRSINKDLYRAALDLLSPME